MAFSQEKITDGTLLVWIGNTPKCSKEELETKLKRLSNNVQIYEKRIDIKNLQDSQTHSSIFVVANQQSSFVDTKYIKDLESGEQICCVWILLAKPNMEKKKGPTSKKEFLKVNYEDSFDDDLLRLIGQRMRQTIRQAIDFNMFDNQKQRTTQDLTRNAATFLWFQILLDVLKENPIDDFAKQEMVEMCKEYYTKNENQIELDHIEEFRLNYKKEDAIHWYTRDCFLHKLLNKALRTEDIHSLHKFRLFIVHLSECIQRLKKESLERGGVKTFKFYRGQWITRMELNQIQNNKEKLISTNGFFSTTTDRGVASSFLKSSPGSKNLVPVLFEISASSDLENVAFADISEFSEFRDECETLFGLGAVFKINDVGNAESMRIIKMSATDEGRKTFEKYRELCKADMEDNRDSVVFGRLLIEMGQYDEAKRYFENHIREIGKVSSDRDIECAPFYHNEGRAYACIGQYNEALQCMKRALEIRQRNLHLNDPDIAQTHNSIGVIEGELGNYANAMTGFKKALGIYEDKLNEKKDDRQAKLQLAATKSNIAWIYYLEGKYDESRKSHDEALKIRETLLGKEHVLIADSWSGQGAIHHAKGEYKEAKDLFQKALDLRLKTLPRNHTSIAISNQSLGAVELEYGRYNDALVLYGKAAEILKETLPTAHLLIAMSEKAIGNVYLEKGEYDKALEYFTRARDICSKTLSDNHPTYGECYHSMAIAYERKGLYKEAQEYYDNAFSRISGGLPTKHPSVAKVLSSMGVFCLRQGYLDKSKTYLTSCQDIQKENYQKHPDLVLTLNNLGVVYTKEKEYEEAERFFRAALTMCKQCFSETHLAISRTLFNLGELQTMVGNYPEALKNYNEALGIRTAALPNNDLSLADIYNSLGYVYSKTDGGIVNARLNYNKAEAIYQNNKYPETHPDRKRTKKNLAIIQSTMK